MAKKEKQGADEGVLATVAKAVGKAAGTVASLAGVAPEAEKPAAPKRVRAATREGRLQPKNKSRLPRKQKKALAKKAAKASTAT